MNTTLTHTHIFCVMFSFDSQLAFLSVSSEGLQVYFLTPCSAWLSVFSFSMANNEEVWVKDLKNGLACLIFDMKRFARSILILLLLSPTPSLTYFTQRTEPSHFLAHKCQQENVSWRKFSFLFTLFIHSTSFVVESFFPVALSLVSIVRMYIIKYFWEFQYF